MNAQTTGNAAVSDAVEPRPKGRFGISAFTLRTPPKREPFVPKPLTRRTPTVKPVDAVTESLAPRKRSGPLPTRTPHAAAAAMHGIVADVPGEAFVPQPVTRPRGPEAILAYLKGRHVELALSADRAHVVPRALSGKLFNIDRDLIERTAPLLVAHLAGAPLVCQVGAHPKDVDATATTLLVGSAPCCAFHLAGGAS